MAVRPLLVLLLVVFPVPPFACLMVLFEEEVPCVVQFSYAAASRACSVHGALADARSY